METPPSISVMMRSPPSSTIEDTIDPQDVLSDFLASATPQMRRLSQHDNSLRRMPTRASDSSDSDDDGPSLAALQRAAKIGEGFENNEESDSSGVGDGGELSSIMLAAAKAAPPSTPVAAATATEGAKKPAAVAAKPRKERPAGELAKQLKFLGKQFKGVESDDVKHVVEVEKAKRDVYTAQVSGGAGPAQEYARGARQVAVALSPHGAGQSGCD